MFIYLEPTIAPLDDDPDAEGTVRCHLFDGRVLVGRTRSDASSRIGR